MCFFSPPSFCESPLSLRLFRLTDTSIHSVSLLVFSLFLSLVFIAVADDDDAGCVFAVADDAGCCCFAVVVVDLVVTVVVAVVGFVLVGVFFFCFSLFVPGSTPLHLYRGGPQFLNWDLH